MNKKENISIAGTLLMTLILVVTFFSPVIIATFTGNWWFMLLFTVSWIPCVAEVLIFSILITPTLDKRRIYKSKNKICK